MPEKWRHHRTSNAGPLQKIEGPAPWPTSYHTYVFQSVKSRVFRVIQNDVSVLCFGTECKCHSGLRHGRFRRRESIQEQKSREVPTGLTSIKSKTVYS